MKTLLPASGRVLLPRSGVPRDDAREANAQHELAMTLRALAETGGGRSAEADELLERLGVVAAPYVPCRERQGADTSTVGSPNDAARPGF